MVGLIITTTIINWLAFEIWRAPILEENPDGTWRTVRDTKKISDLFKKKSTLLLLLVLLFNFSYSQDTIRIKRSIYEVLYSQKLEQPLWLQYRSTNRPTNVNRGSMDFYTESGIRTSDAADYAKNVYDKGHLAPAATFSDNTENLKTTFSYLNCVLQNQYLNRGEWRLLEEQERKWDNNEPLIVLIEVSFITPVEKLPTGASIPTHFTKHIYFENSKKWKCFLFLNRKPVDTWQNSEFACNNHLIL